MKKILLLDKDGTLTNTISNAKFVNEPKDQKVIEGMPEALKLAKENGYSIGVVSNQAGIDYGFKSLENTVLEFKFVKELYPEIEATVFCPTKDGSNCFDLERNTTIDKQIATSSFDEMRNLEATTHHSFRKPGIGMLAYLIGLFDCTICLTGNLSNITYVGDREEDEIAADKLGIRFIWADVFAKDYKRFL